ncbi:hypothetical protein VdG2_07677 [Verticillium dahliae VDG2]|nr:hypothetical protein VdG2_07677 [Verticillium dahliae VDG2]
MCQTVYYSYSCGHLECVVYRCRRIPAHPSRWELYDCAPRAAPGGSWGTSLREPCHDCVEAERLRRWTLQRGGRAAPWNLAGRSMSNGTRISQSASAPNVGEVQNQHMGWDGRVIRPLDSNYLGNIGRITLDGVHWEDVTPAEIFEARF